MEEFVNHNYTELTGGVFTTVERDGIGTCAAIEVIIDLNSCAPGALQITSSRPYTTTTAVVISLTTPVLNRVEHLGVGDFKVNGLSGGSLEAFMSGVGNVTASGSVDSLDVLLQGVGNMSLLDLAASRTRALLLGVGVIDVNATESLFARVHGIGDITYTGNPAEIDTDVKGIGNIRPQ